ncbi:uncharacterized protein LOC144106513 [Amblyomma americanum]
MSHAVSEEARGPAEEAARKPATFSEHVSAAVGSRSYLWTVAAIAGILVVSSMMATSGSRGSSAPSQGSGSAQGSGRSAVAPGSSAALPSVEGQLRGDRKRQPMMQGNQAKALRRSRAGRSSAQKGAPRPAPSAAGDRQLDADSGEPEYIRQVEGCRSTVCRWQGEYLGGKLDETVDPCMDFYSYACPSRWFHQDTLAAMPYRVYAAGQLMYRLENMFHEFRQADTVNEGNNRNTSFLSRAANFFLRCVSKEQSRGPWSDLLDLFRHYGLESYPYSVTTNGSSPSSLPHLTRVVGMLDRELSLAAFFRPSLTTARRRRQAKGIVLFLDPPESTHSLRLRGALGKEDKELLLQKITTGFALLKKPAPELTDEAHQVLAVDQELATIVEMENRASRRGHWPEVASSRKSSSGGLVSLMSVRKLAKHYNAAMWSWDTYAQLLLGDVAVEKNASKEPLVLVQVDRTEQLKKLSVLLRNHGEATLLNYVGFSLAAFVSPALPHGGPAQELLPLSHGEHVPQVPEELQACFHLLARTYRFGALSLARQAVSRDPTDGSSYKYEGEMRVLVDGARDQLSALLRNGTAWMTASELWTALQRLDTLRVVFLGEPEDTSERLSRYYASALNDVSGGSLNARLRDWTTVRQSRENTNHSGNVATFTSTTGAKPTLLQEYVLQQTETNNLYWGNLNRTEENLETRWPPMHVEPRVDYFEARNTLLISPSLVSFLSSLLVGLDPLVLPVLGSDVVGGLLSVVASSRRLPGVDNVSARLPEIGGIRTLAKRRENATRCFQAQYANLTGDRQRWTSVPEQLFFESAVVEPLFALYRSYLEKYPELRDGPNIPELPGKNALELFFVNYAVAHCEHVPRSEEFPASVSARTQSPAARLNMALMNSPAFSSVFHCKDDDVMNARNKCEIW